MIMMSGVSSGVLVLAVTFHCVQAGLLWSYHGRHSSSHWPDLYPSCNGRRQSPIDLDPFDVTMRDFGGINLDIDWPKGTEVIGTIDNNGHTAKVTFSGMTSSVSGGPLKSEYRLEQIHFHWGSSNSQGSEHTVTRNRFPMEMHAVHKNVHGDDYVVLGSLFFATEVEDENMGASVLYDILDLASGVGPNDTAEITLQGKEQFIKDIYSGDIKDIVNGVETHHIEDFCSYLGSLTTPPCSEVVTWVMATNRRIIPQSLLNKLRNLRTGHVTSHISNNFRDPQPLHGRKVECNIRVKQETTNHLVKFDFAEDDEDLKIVLYKAGPFQLEELKSLIIGKPFKVFDNDTAAIKIEEPMELTGIEIKSHVLQLGSIYAEDDSEEGIAINIVTGIAATSFFQINERYYVGRVVEGLETLARMKSGWTVESISEETSDDLYTLLPSEEDDEDKDKEVNKEHGGGSDVKKHADADRHNEINNHPAQPVRENKQPPRDPTQDRRNRSTASSLALPQHLIFVLLWCLASWL